MLPLLPQPLMLDHPDPTETAARLNRHGYALLSTSALTGLTGTSLAALQALNPAWNDLPADAHLKDGGRYRRRRHGSYVQDTTARTLATVPHRAHWQPTTYNALHGGMLRWFEPLAPEFAADAAFLTVVQALGQVFAQARQAQQAAANHPARPPADDAAPFDGRWFVEVHPFRIDTADGVGRPTPEGAHRDGVAYVAVLLADRVAVRGGETRVFEADGPHGVRFTLTQPWSALLIDDERVIHESTPIQPEGDDPTLGHRDTLVITYRAGCFQDPPA